MDLLDFHFASATALAYALLKWLLMGLMVAASRVWNRTLLAISLGAGLLLLGVGMVFKIEHWVFGSELMLAGAIVVAGAYALWFRAKGQRGLLDYLKLAWLLAAMGTMVAIAVFHPLVAPLGGVTEALFWAMALLFAYQRWIQRSGAATE